MKKELKKISKIIFTSSRDIEENLKRYKGEIIVVKYGGSAMLDPKLSETFFKDIEIITEEAINFEASRTNLNNIWLEKVEHILEKFHGDKIHVIPNLAGSLPNNCFTDILGIPTIWIPHSYKECSQHAPNEHVPVKLLKNSLLLMTDLYWNLGKNV